jgi:hypothetical protein
MKTINTSTKLSKNKLVRKCQIKAHMEKVKKAHQKNQGGHK